MDRMLVGMLFGGLLIGLALAITARLRAQWRARFNTDGPEPRCRQCGYIVAAGASRVCPECGGDLRTLGVTSPTLARPIYPRGLIIGGGVFLAPLALLAAALIHNYVPWRWFAEYQVTSSIPTGIPATQPGTPDALIELAASGFRTFRHELPRRLDVTWWAYSDGAMRWEVDMTYGPPERRWRATTRPFTAERFDRFDESTASRFIELAGVDPRSPRGIELAQKTLAELGRLERGEFPRGPVMTNWGMQDPIRYTDRYALPRAFAIAGLLWLPAWWLMTRFLARRYRRRLSIAQANEQAALDELGVAK